MFVALDENAKRVCIDDVVSMDYETKNFYCPLCRKDVIVRNGGVVSAHFAHKSKCDETFTNDMSEWHLKWQSLFPKETREVVIEAEIDQYAYDIEKTYYMQYHEGQYIREHMCKSDIKDAPTIKLKHRADVCINGYVIEFQHSPISAEEFAERNVFYTLAGYKVIWIFDYIDAVADGKMNAYAEIKGKYYNKTKWQWNHASRTFAYFCPEFFKVFSTTKVLVFFQIFDTEDYEDIYDTYLEQVIWCVHDNIKGCENYRRFMTQNWPGNFKQLLRAIQNNKLLN